jgi:hypothetical protein
MTLCESESGMILIPATSPNQNCVWSNIIYMSQRGGIFPRRDWGNSAIIGVSIASALLTVKLMETLLTAQIGSWPAFGIGVVAAIIVCVIVGNPANAVFKK